MEFELRTRAFTIRAASITECVEKWNRAKPNFNDYADVIIESIESITQYDTRIETGDFVVGTNLGASNEDIEGKVVLVTGVARIRDTDWLSLQGSRHKWLASHFRIATEESQP